jgi:hypothetical protein
MKADALARLRRIARGEAVTPDTGAVTPKTPGVAPVTSLPLKNDRKGQDAAEVSARSLPTPNDAEADPDAIEERAGLAADCVPACYLDAWARLNHEKPFRVSDAEWRLALDDGGRFLDAWGNDAADMGWRPGELFDVTVGLIWRLAGERVAALGPDYVRIADGRSIDRRRSADVHRSTAARPDGRQAKERI